jgi:hypothetical protein
LGWEGICDGQGDAMATAEIVMVWKYFIGYIFFGQVETGMFLYVGQCNT